MSSSPRGGKAVRGATPTTVNGGAVSNVGVDDGE